MGMYDNFKDILNVLYFDEELLRLLYYPPADLANNIPDPLDDSLLNINDMSIEQQWDIRNDRIMLTPRTSDLESTPICRLLLYAGRRKPTNGNYLMAKQQFVIDVLCHNDFENKDIRSTRISDRLNKLLALQHITGIGKMDYADGGQMKGAPEQYVGYTHVYEFGSTKS